VDFVFRTFSFPILESDIAGLYAVELVVSDEFNPSQPDTLMVQVGMISSTNPEIGTATDIRLFPNPASELLNIQFDRSVGQQDLSIIILDMAGKILSTQMNQVNGQKNVQLPLSKLNLEDGMYLLQVGSESFMNTLPFVVHSN